MGFKKKILSKSSSYSYYKDNYESLSSQIAAIKEENDKLKIDLKNANDDIFQLQNKYHELVKQNILNKLNNEEYSNLNLAIKTPNPKSERHWGDYFFALALKKSFQKKGFNVVIHEVEDWYEHNFKADINIVLRGLTKYEPNFNEFNMMWNISHPELVTREEYELYDICFISSEYYAKKLESETETVVRPLLQCTDPEVFYYSEDESLQEDLLFVGMPRGVFREIVKDVMETDFEVSIYGTHWERFVDEKYIKGQFIPNNELNKYYSSCKILLNDHWEIMKELDFPSNRLFDALACGTFIISDKIPSADTLFEGSVLTYENVQDLNNKIEYYLSHDVERKKMAEKGKELVLKNHTFDNRVDEIIDYLKKLFME